RPAFAQLPSVTSVGMAGLLPEAEKDLQILRQDNMVVPALGSMRVANVNQRMEILRQRYGHRFAEMTLGNFLQTKKGIDDGVELLLIRSTEIDSHLETVPETALRSIYDTLKRIRVAIHKLKDRAFQDVVIATDHGFFLNTHVEAGDVCSKPPGNWVVVHDRFVLGDGAADGANWVLPAERLGIRGDFAQAGGPRSLVSYRAGQPYFHGGVSLQECVVPVILIRLGEKPPQQPKPLVRLAYKAGAKRITTRLPVVDVLFEAHQIGLFHPEEELEVLIEAHDKKGQVVGEAKAGGPVNPATGTLTLKPGQLTQVTMKMLLDFEGKFTIKALNPTTLATYDKLDLETDYVV
ncbi:MAG: PglZ domain-containing protein, partial [Desulfobacterales bacterium]|nr:PglZ domain-containing protein [Desulfobacterales bacterium]